MWTAPLCASAGRARRGGARLLHFFTTTCRYYKASVPELKQVAAAWPHGAPSRWR